MFIQIHIVKSQKASDRDFQVRSGPGRAAVMPKDCPLVLFASHSTGQCWHVGQRASNGQQRNMVNLIAPLPHYSLKLRSIIFLGIFSQIQK